MNARMWLMRFSSFFQKQSLEQDLEQEIQEHLEMATEENLRRGMTPREAEAAARRSFGGVEQMKEELRDQRGIPVLESFARETRFAFRSLRRAPGFTLLAVLTLALGIGANSAIFSAVNALLFSPPGISEPTGVVVFRARYDKLNLRNLMISLNDFNDVSGSTEIFSAAAIAKTGNFTYTGGAFPQRLAAMHVSLRWFEVFGAQPARGRVFAAEEDQPNSNHVAVVSYGAWQRVFGGDPSLVGKSIELDQVPYQVIGIMRPESATTVNELGGLSGQSVDIFTPMAARATTPRIQYTETYLGVARLKHGISFAKARAFMDVLTARGLQDRLAGRPRKENGWGLFVVPYTDFAGGDFRTPMLILWGAVGFVLLIVCANIAGLMLARTSARSREFAVRTALGASRSHLLRQLFAESLLLAVAGSALGVCVAFVIIQGVEMFGPENVVTGLKIPFDMPMLMFTAMAGMLSAALFGVVPARQIGRPNTSEALKASARTGTPTRGRLRLRFILVTAEVALALVLSIGAGLLLRSLSLLQRVDVGFRPDGAMSALVTLPQARYKEPEKAVAFARGAIERLTALPGVKSAAIAYPLPFGQGFESRAFRIVGRPVRENDPLLLANILSVTPEFFSTLRIPLKRGRAFTEQDTQETELIAIVDETLAQQYWPNENPVGQRILLQGGTALSVVGVVGHIKQSDLSVRFRQRCVLYLLLSGSGPLRQYRRTGCRECEQRDQRDAGQAVSSVDPAQAIYDAKTNGGTCFRIARRTAIHGYPSRIVCGDRGVPGGARFIRGDQLRCDTANPRNRNPSGHGRPAHPGPESDRGSGTSDHCNRTRVRLRRGLCDRANASESVVRGAGFRSWHVCGHGDCIDGGCSVRKLRSGEKGHEAGSRGGVPL